MARRRKKILDIGRFSELLRDRGYRVTKQRLAVHTAMLTLGNATADEVLEYIEDRQKGLKVSVSSVYNILSKMADMGLYNRIQGIGASRLNQDDENFRQDTVAQTGTIEAAVLIMRPHVISNRVANGRKSRITRTFTVEIVTVNGELIMKCDKQLGFSRTRGVVGW